VIAVIQIKLWRMAGVSAEIQLAYRARNAADAGREHLEDRRESLSDFELHFLLGTRSRISSIRSSRCGFPPSLLGDQLLRSQGPHTAPPAPLRMLRALSAEAALRRLTRSPAVVSACISRITCSIDSTHFSLENLVFFRTGLGVDLKITRFSRLSG